MNWIRRTSLIAVISALALSTGVAGALAATVSEVVDEVSATGVYLDPGVSISESDATEIVSAARNNGSRFHLVVLNDTPLGGNTAFAEAVLDDMNLDAGTVLVLSAEDVGWVSDNEGFSEADLEAAYEFANEEGGTDAEYAANFVIALFGQTEIVPEPTSPPTTTAAAPVQPADSSGGGGGSGLLWFFVIIVGVGLLLFWLVRRGSKQTVNAAAEQLAKVRGEVQKQVDAIANDILDMEDEVRVANNAEVDEFYNNAGETYRAVTERLPKADSPQELMDLSNDLNEAIWQLDCAEALLDGKPKPPRPEKERIEPAGSSADRVTVPAPRTDYQRRPGRRSSYMGPGMMEILIGVAGQVLVSNSRRGGGMFGRSSSSQDNTPPRASGSSGSSGGGVVPGPGSPVPRSSSQSTSSRSSRSSRTRRRGGGRVRGGGKRRRR